MFSSWQTAVQEQWITVLYVAAHSCVAFRLQNLPHRGRVVRLASASQFGWVTTKENSRHSVMSVSRGPPGRRVPPVAARIIEGDSDPSFGLRCGFLISMIHCCNLDTNELPVAACKVQWRETHWAQVDVLALWTSFFVSCIKLNIILHLQSVMDKWICILDVHSQLRWTAQIVFVKARLSSNTVNWFLGGGGRTHHKLSYLH